MEPSSDYVTFLTLGDGDFSYSLDMAMYLSRSTKANKTAALPSRILATGIDSLEEVNSKYRNAPFLAKQLLSLNQEASISVTILHGINAVQPPPLIEADSWQADHVIFNHPHVGTEDATLHSRFISHFLDTCSSYWMRRDGGILHLTLVKGQYERWKCEESAQRHDLILLETNYFVPPPGGGHYHHRRHQTGKSFASRATGGSETLTFGRTKDRGKYVATCLPWQTHALVEEEFPCPFCEKTFREERSRTSHLKAVHSNDSEKKRKRNEFFHCQSCTRTFTYEQALTDHVRAKHTSLHSIIQPTWAGKDYSPQEPRSDDTSNLNRVQAASENATYGSCSVCGMIYKTKEHETKHLKEFVPVASSVADAVRVTKEAGAIMEHQCSFCNKQFRDKRAQLQHENFCTCRSTGQDKDNRCRSTTDRDGR
jgi:uncharacterized C2H2 Zn-finger protein